MLQQQQQLQQQLPVVQPQQQQLGGQTKTIYIDTSPINYNVRELEKDPYSDDDLEVVQL